MKRILRSLQAKYMLIILMAISLIFFIQIAYTIIFSMLVGGSEEENVPAGSEGATNYEMIEEKWHEEANAIENISGKQISQHFETWKEEYPDASMFWVDENDTLREQVGVTEQLPSEWSSAYTAEYIKSRYGGDPFTVIAFLGEKERNGFIVLEIPRSTFDPPLQKAYDQYGMFLMICMVLFTFVFIVVSFLFFRGIRKRLLRLQEAMAIRDVDGLPIETDMKKKDEVGQLEQTFNQMVNELRESRQREQAEEQLRRELIANLSHDLRTPLTKISAQIYSLAKEELTHESKSAIKTLETSVRDIDRLIENLMSYTLLMASKYKYQPKEVDVVRFVRESLATWYPVFEQEGFEMEFELEPFQQSTWAVDPMWFNRVLDNLFQNVLRHAKSGRFVKVKTESTKEYDAITIIDHGKGMDNVSVEKGAGIGLSIVDMMVKGMRLDWDIESSSKGTTIKIKNDKPRASEREE
ncbi:HAMP domain-containing sensor histidine kinase [Sediminibacillus massiliensis]|uniref:HAMP domain-containing sensor histidine kinase n=1 Tax=Sediminibacillus massiliensis TaxID=1926277 RepID=UPI0009885CC1|nr:HAMP domain-containing sensor histidine kinase [Sediminibacillus massiliensis]